MRKFSQFLNGYWKRETGANIDVVYAELELELELPANPLIAINVAIAGDFRLAERPHTKSSGGGGGLFMYIINHKLLLRLKVNDFVYFLGLPESGSGGGCYREALAATPGPLVSYISLCYTRHALRPTAHTQERVSSVFP